MTRLTKKDERYIGDYCCAGSFDINWKEKAYFKLGQLEDIEEELGIDLITLFKVSPLQLKALAELTKEELEWHD